MTDSVFTVDFDTPIKRGCVVELVALRNRDPAASVAELHMQNVYGSTMIQHDKETST